jgi:hypothetical protein
MKIAIALFCFIICLAFSAYSYEKPLICADSTRIAVEVTVYNNNMGLIKDTRKIRLPAGYGELRFMDVASSIIPVTVRAVSLSSPGDFTVLEQNYEYDLMNDDKLLDKYVGRKVKLLDVNQFTGKSDTLNAVLLSNNQGQIYRINDEIFLGHPGIKILPSIPENLIANPTLMWLFENKRAAEHRLEVTYLTGDISWTADYVLVLDRDDLKSDLTGWVSIDNQSGASYKNARLTLVAGKVNVVEPEMHVSNRSAKVMATQSYGSAPQFSEKEFFEYHIYNLQRPATVKSNQTKQIQLFSASQIETAKEFQTWSAAPIYGRRNDIGAIKQPVNVFINFQNSRKNSLGMPLPAGTIRVYKKDESGALQFVGEDRIDHTPENESLKLKTGEAFDIMAERTQKSYSETGSRASESEWEISIKNHKKQSATVGVIERLNGEWKILSKSHNWEKVDAFTIKFNVDIQPGNETKITYKVKTQW